MKKQIITLILAIFLISFISAIDIYSGESTTLELDKPYVYYSIVGNSTPIDLEITQNGNNVTIFLGKYNLNDTFEIVFFDREKETITVYSGGGRGGSSTKYVDRNVTVEVPTYVDKEVEIEVEKEVEIEKEVYKNSWWSWVILIVSIIIISALIRNVLKERKENIYTDERGLENGKEEENI
jgi:hypothetical protein